MQLRRQLQGDQTGRRGRTRGLAPADRQLQHVRKHAHLHGADPAPVDPVTQSTAHQPSETRGRLQGPLLQLYDLCCPDDMLQRWWRGCLRPRCLRAAIATADAAAAGTATAPAQRRPAQAEEALQLQLDATLLLLQQVTSVSELVMYQHSDAGERREMGAATC